VVDGQFVSHEKEVNLISVWLTSSLDGRLFMCQPIVHMESQAPYLSVILYSVFTDFISKD